MNANQTDQRLLSTAVKDPSTSENGNFPPSTLSLPSSSPSPSSKDTSTDSSRQQTQGTQQQQQRQQPLSKLFKPEQPAQQIEQLIQQQEITEQQIGNNNNNDIRLLSSSDYKDELDYFHVIGEVENTSPDAQEFIKVTSSFYDSSNKIVGTSFAYTDVDVLRPGEKSPFDIILHNKDQSKKVSSYKLAISSDDSDPKPSYLKL